MDERTLTYAKELARLIQTPTTVLSDTVYFEKFHEVLWEIFPNIKAQTEIKKIFGNALLIKWKGKTDKNPLMLMGHQDGAPVNEEGWDVPPFSGEIKDGKIWGRGAIDDKNTVYLSLKAIDELIGEGFVPETDVYFASSDNEEAAGEGTPHILEYLQENGIKPAIVIDEGGAVVTDIFSMVKKPVAAIGIIEKGFGVYKFTAKSHGGHTTTPPKNTPFERLSAFITDISKHNYFKPKMTKEVVAMISGISGATNGIVSFVLKHIKLLKPIITPILPKLDPFFKALLSTTITFTMAGGSELPNVIPNEAYVVANTRYASHFTVADGEKLFKKLAKKHDIEFENIMARDATPVVDINSESYKFVENCVKQVYKDCAVIPYVVFGATDCRYMFNVSPCALRFTPFRLSSEQMSKMHADNENVDASALPEGVDFFKLLISTYKG